MATRTSDIPDIGSRPLDDRHCGVARALEQFGDGWTILVLREAFFGTRRFADFQSRLGIARNVLTDRLRGLLDNEILEKRLKPGSMKSHEYHLTRKGRDLWVVLTALRLWSDKWVFGEGHEPVVVREQGTRRTVRRLVAVDGAGRPVDPGKLGFARGPGAEESSA